MLLTDCILSRSNNTSADMDNNKNPDVYPEKELLACIILVLSGTTESRERKKVSSVFLPDGKACIIRLELEYC